ncbi:MAG: WxL domain-containing protein [Gaiellaceae bacterium]
MSNARYLRRLSALATALLGAAVCAPLAPGTLTITSPLAADFAGVTLDGAAQNRTAALDGFSVTHSTVPGAGWTITVQATQFKEYAAGAYVGGGKTLPAGSLAMPAPTVTPVGTSSPAPTIEAGAPWAIDGASAVKIASAPADEGMGQYDFGAVTLSLIVPASAYAKTYRSDVTFSAVVGP